jgi:hypothetical protein
MPDSRRLGKEKESSSGTASIKTEENAASGDLKLSIRMKDLIS